jgi:hypothetical protein
MEGLAGDGAQRVAVAERTRVAETEIGPRSTLDAVIAGELVAVEQRGRIEDEALRVLVRQTAGIFLVGADIDLSDRLDDVAAVVGRQEG